MFLNRMLTCFSPCQGEAEESWEGVKPNMRSIKPQMKPCCSSSPNSRGTFLNIEENRKEVPEARRGVF